MKNSIELNFKDVKDFKGNHEEPVIVMDKKGNVGYGLWYKQENYDKGLFKPYDLSDEMHDGEFEITSIVDVVRALKEPKKIKKKTGSWSMWKHIRRIWRVVGEMEDQMAELGKVLDVRAKESQDRHNVDDGDGVLDKIIDDWKKESPDVVSVKKGKVIKNGIVIGTVISEELIQVTNEQAKEALDEIEKGALIKPGLTPRKLWMSKRIDKIQTAIIKCIEAKADVPQEWRDELRSLRANLDMMNYTKPIKSQTPAEKEALEVLSEFGITSPEHLRGQLNSLAFYDQIKEQTLKG